MALVEKQEKLADNSQTPVANPAGEEILSFYEDTILLLAQQLTDSQTIAQQVLAEVNEKLNNMLSSALSEPVEVLVHRYTYESAIAHLLQNITEEGESAETFVKIISH